MRADNSLHATKVIPFSKRSVRSSRASATRASRRKEERIPAPNPTPAASSAPVVTEQQYARQSQSIAVVAADRCVTRGLPVPPSSEIFFGAGSTPEAAAAAAAADSSFAAASLACFSRNIVSDLW